jgi:hypothetical protein
VQEVSDCGLPISRWNDQGSSARMTIPDLMRSAKRLRAATRCRTSSIVALVPSEKRRLSAPSFCVSNSCLQCPSFAYFFNGIGQIRPPRPNPEDVPPRRVTLRFPTNRRGSAVGLGGLSIRCNAPRPRTELTIVRRPNTDVFSAHAQRISWAKLTTVARETPTSSFNVKAPSSRVFWALSFKSLLIAMAHLRGHCCVTRSPRGSAVIHTPSPRL